MGRVLSDFAALLRIKLPTSELLQEYGWKWHACFNITEFAEKPNLDFARSSLRVPGLADGEYLTIFGEYIIKPKIFDYLEENIKNNIRERGEFPTHFRARAAGARRTVPRIGL